MIVPGTMLCAYCGSTRRWPDDFPSSIEACCRECWAKLYPAPRLSLWTRVRAWLARALGVTPKERA